MTNLTKLFIILGCVLMLVAIFIRVTWLPYMLASRTVKPSSFLILANTALKLALLSKK